MGRQATRRRATVARERSGHVAVPRRLLGGYATVSAAVIRRLRCGSSTVPRRLLDGSAAITRRLRGAPPASASPCGSLDGSASPAKVAAPKERGCSAPSVAGLRGVRDHLEPSFLIWPTRGAAEAPTRTRGMPPSREAQGATASSRTASVVFDRVELRSTSGRHAQRDGGVCAIARRRGIESGQRRGRAVP